jgi:hypothetical protein
MPESPKSKRAAPGAGASSPTARPDRTSTVVTGTLILLTVLGVVTVFWEPLAAIAAGGSAGETTAEPRSFTPDGGAAPAPASAPTPVDASGNS